ncbi:MAG: hypothetical protein KDD25_05690 [Bdellovibrionales bacterium]|nr:hypothetical protein [Bdellovibrionales bacterium]
MARLNTTKSKRGPEPKFTPTEEDLAQIEAMAQRGMNQKHIAMRYGLSESAWYETKARNPHIQERIEKGKGSGIQYVISLLWERIQRKEERALYYYLDKIAGFETKALLNVTHNYDQSQTTINNLQNNFDFSKLSESELKTLVIQSMQSLSSKDKPHALEGNLQDDSDTAAADT